MKNSNGRDKNVKTQTILATNKLLKTDINQPQKYQQMERTNYNRPSSGKKIQSNKNLPPKAPGAKKQYIIQDNMTQSRINQAKQGLQLLKKKMSAKGLSRQKNSITQQYIQQKPIPSFKKVSSKNDEAPYYQNRNSNMPQKNIDKKQGQQVLKSKLPTSTKLNYTKNFNQTKKTPQNQKKLPPPPPPTYNQYHNQQMQVPIKPKKDFNVLLEQQLRKQKQIKQPPTNNIKNNSYNNQINQYPQQNMQMVQCRHCQRKFSQVAIDKHQGICLKVFLTKRKAFDSAAHRAPQVQGFQKIQMQSKKQDQKNMAKKQAVLPKNEQNALPKWKAESLAFRASMKAAKGAQLTAQQKKATETAQGLVLCNHCGRKFNQKAATRHIPFCQTKSKQLPKTTISKKR